MLKYTVDNTQDYLNFKIDSIENIESVPWDYPIVIIKDIPLKFLSIISYLIFYII